MGRGRSTGPGPPRSSRTGRETIFYVGLSFLVCLLIAQGVHLWDASVTPPSITTVLSTTQVVRDQTSTRSGSKERKVTTTTNLIIDGFLRDAKYRSQLDPDVRDASGVGISSRGSDRLQIQPSDTEGRAIQAGDVLRGLAVQLSARSTIKHPGEGTGLRDTSLTTSQLPKAVPRRFGQGGNGKGGGKKGGSAGGVIQKSGNDGVPASFDWQTYLLYHPEVKEAGVDSEEAAKRHYIEVGRQLGFIYKRLRVIMRYTACGGLINQQYSHIAAFSLAAVLGSELVLAPAVKRDSFAHYFSTFKEQNEVSWAPVPLESLLDVEALLSFWSNRSLTVHRVRHEQQCCRPATTDAPNDLIFTWLSSVILLDICRCSTFSVRSHNVCMPNQFCCMVNTQIVWACAGASIASIPRLDTAGICLSIIQPAQNRCSKGGPLGTCLPPGTEGMQAHAMQQKF
jgi:hypothetical protein